jgi:DNA-binding response OmpR family regulator
VRKRIASRAEEEGAEAATAPVLRAVRRLAREVRTLVADLDGLRSENEALRAERQDLLAALTAISRPLSRRTGARAQPTPAMARPSGRSRPKATPAADRLRLDRASHVMHVDDHRVPLAPREFDLLSYLLDHAGQALTREALLRAVWPASSSWDARTLRVHVNAIRAKLDRLGLAVRITTLHRVGYRLDHLDDVRGPE